MMMRALTGLSVALALVAAPALAADAPPPPPVTAADHVLGRSTAQVTIIEYASLTCSHCKDWHDDVLPALKTRYIDTGKARFVYRTLPTAPVNVAQAAAGVAQCAAPGKFFDTIDAFFAAQSALPTTGTGPYFERGVTASGRTHDEIGACLNEPATLAALQAQIEGAVAAGVEGTPSLFVNGRRVTDISLAGLSAAIDPLLRR